MRSRSFAAQVFLVPGKLAMSSCSSPAMGAAVPISDRSTSAGPGGQRSVVTTTTANGALSDDAAPQLQWRRCASRTPPSDHHRGSAAATAPARADPSRAPAHRRFIAQRQQGLLGDRAGDSQTLWLAVGESAREMFEAIAQSHLPQELDHLDRPRPVSSAISAAFSWAVSVGIRLKN